jgi:hypothetical protein
MKHAHRTGLMISLEDSDIDLLSNEIESVHLWEKSSGHKKELISSMVWYDFP